jgi:hypothetical protein
MSSSSSTLVRERNPRDRSTRVCTDLIWAIRGSVGNNFLLFAPNPNSGIRANLCVVCLYD